MELSAAEVKSRPRRLAGDESRLEAVEQAAVNEAEAADEALEEERRATAAAASMEKAGDTEMADNGKGRGRDSGGVEDGELEEWELAKFRDLAEMGELAQKLLLEDLTISGHLAEMETLAG